jgi:pimeloyl-ACP methyl ester carboxylesterase
MCWAGREKWRGFNVTSARTVFLYWASAILACLLAGCRPAKGPDLTAEVESARRNHIVVVDGRRAVDRSAEPSRTEPLWAANAIPGKPAPAAPRELGLTSGAKAVVIFVHGYNVSAADALEESGALWRHIQESNEHLRQKFSTLPTTDSIAFLTFLWKGDFGELHFSTAQHAAENTARAFADFLNVVAQQARGARIVILTHSLGSEVALEALRSMEEASTKPAVDNLILVQGAVPAYTVYRWIVRYQRLPAGAREELKPEQVVEQCSGKYASAIRMALQFGYTFSEKDEVLGNRLDMGPFQVNERLKPLTRTCQLPVMPGSGGTVVRVSALGSVFDTNNRTEMIPPPKALEPLVRQREQPGFHPMPLLPPGATVFRYTDFTIDHPHVERLNIASAEDVASGVFRGHSVLFQAEGQRVMDDLWELAAASWQ